MLTGYMRMAEADGFQMLDLQRDALLGAGIPANRPYEDHASGKRDGRPEPRPRLRPSYRGGSTGRAGE